MPGMTLPCHHAAQLRHLFQQGLQILIHLLPLIVQLSKGALSSLEALLCALQGPGCVCLSLCDGLQLALLV